MWPEEGRRYQLNDRFAAAGVGLEFQDFEHRRIRSVGSPVRAGLSCLDAMFHCGLSGAGDLLQQSGRAASWADGQQRPSASVGRRAHPDGCDSRIHEAANIPIVVNRPSRFSMTLRPSGPIRSCWSTMGAPTERQTQ